MILKDVIILFGESGSRQISNCRKLMEAERKKERSRSRKQRFFFFFYSMNNFAWLQIEVERRLNSEEEPIRIGSTRFSRKRKFFDPIEGYRIAKPRRVDCEKAAQKDLRWLCIVEEIAGQKSRVRFA